MPTVESRLTLMLALDPLDWRAENRGRWVQTLVNTIDSAVPHLLHVEGYEVRETLVYVRMRSNRPPKILNKLLREDESFRRLRARLADLGARGEYEIAEVDDAAD